MEIQVHEQGSQLRCYVCGSPEVAVICHHCGRPMCARHGPVQTLLHRLRFLGWFTESREFAGLTLGAWPLTRTSPAHCKTCAHSSPDYRRRMVVPGAVVLLIGLWWLLMMLVGLGTCLVRWPVPFEAKVTQVTGVDLQTVPSLGLAEVLRDPAIYDNLLAQRCYQPVLMRRVGGVLRAWLVVLFGAITTGLGVYLNHKRVAADLAGGEFASPVSPGFVISGERIAAEAVGEHPPVPLGPVTDRIEVRETLHAEILLDTEGRSTAYITRLPQGEIDSGLHFTAMDRQRVNQYRAKYGLKEQDYIAFRAGYLALAGRPLLHFAMRPSRRTVFWLRGQVGEHPYLTGESSDSSLPLSWRYTIPLETEQESRLSQGGWNNVPLRLVPLLVEMGDARRLQLEVQFNAADFPFLGPEQGVVLEEMQLWVDQNRLGWPQTSGVITEDKGRDAFRVEWRGLRFPAGRGVARFHLPEIRFAQPIQPGTRLVGHLRLRVPALRSGLSGVNYFSALGHPLGYKKDKTPKSFPFRGSTYLEVEFDLALARLPQAELVTINCDLNTQSALEPTRLRRLLDMLNTDPISGGPAQHTYLQQVMENPSPGWGQGTHAGPSYGRWHWDIWGRCYHQTLPVDFHLVMYGEEERGGKSRVEISVQGQVFDPISRQAVGDTLDELRQRIIKAIG